MYMCYTNLRTMLSMPSTQCLLLSLSLLLLLVVTSGLEWQGDFDLSLGSATHQLHDLG